MDRRATVVITGAAGGIGRDTAAVLLGLRHPVVGVDINPSVVDSPTGDGDRYVGVVAAIADESDLTALRARLAGDPSVAHLVLAAGGALAGEILPQDPLDLSAEVFTRPVHLNLTAQYLTVRHLSPALVSGDGATGQSPSCRRSTRRNLRRTGVLRGEGRVGRPGHIAAFPLRRHRVRVNAVAFGTVRTPASDELHVHQPERATTMAALSALDQTMTADAAADVVAVITQLHAVTGTVLTVDGGQSVPGHRNRVD